MRGPCPSGLLVVVVVVVVTEASKVLECGVECACEEEKGQQHDFKVSCNATHLQEAVLTEAVLTTMTNSTPRTSSRAMVSVSGGASLTITAPFLRRWRRFPICLLVVTGRGGAGLTSLILPAKMHRFSPSHRRMVHYYAGVALTRVVVSEIPAGVFNSTAASLRLTNTTVGRLPRDLLTGADSLCRLHVNNSTVGIMERLAVGVGRRGRTKLTTTTTPDLRDDKPVWVVNSTIGEMRGGAVNLHMQSNQKIVVHGSVLGRVQAGAVEVEGGGVVVVERCLASLVEAEAVRLAASTSLTLRYNFLTLRPAALTDFKCDNPGRRMGGMGVMGGMGEVGESLNDIHDNSFSLLTNGSSLPVSLTLQEQEPTQELLREEYRQQIIRLEHNLSQILHPSCVSYNLPTLPTTPTASPTPKSSPIILFSVVGVVVGVVMSSCLLCILMCVRKRRQSRQRHVKPQTVVMSQINEEPIYEEPPELPPFPTLRRLDPCSPRDDCCRGGDTWGKKTVENEYMEMGKKIAV